MRDEQELIRDAARGDRRAFDALVVLKRERVVRTAYRVTGNLEDARDVAQTVFLTLWRSLDRYDPERTFDTWLHRMTVNAAIDHLRSRRPDATARPLDDSLDGPKAPSAAPAGERRVLDEELRRAFRELAAELPPQQRAAFVLREVEGYRTSEIAAILGVRESTVRNHLLLARRALRRGLAARFPDLVRELGSKGRTR